MRILLLKLPVIYLDYITAAACIWALPLKAAADSDTPHLITSEVTSETDGVLTLADGQKWYKVNSFEDNNDYIITVDSPSGNEQLLTLTEGESKEYVWHYYRQTSSSPRLSTASGRIP